MSETLVSAGRKDWDFVSFPDYQSDMDELVQRSAGIIEAQRRQISQMKRLITAIVEAAGGRVEVPEPNLDPDRAIMFIREYNPAKMVYIFRTAKP